METLSGPKTSEMRKEMVKVDVSHNTCCVCACEKCEVKKNLKWCCCVKKSKENVDCVDSAPSDNVSVKSLKRFLCCLINNNE